MRLLAAGLWLGLSYVWIRASASPADWNDVPSTIQSLDPRPVGTERMLPARRRLRGPPAARQRSSDASIESSNETGANQTATRTSAPAELHDFAARAPGPPPPSWAIVSKPQVTMCTMESFGDTTFGPCYTVTPDLTGSGKNCRKMPPFTGSGSFVVGHGIKCRVFVDPMCNDGAGYPSTSWIYPPGVLDDIGYYMKNWKLPADGFVAKYYVCQSFFA